MPHIPTAVATGLTFIAYMEAVVIVLLVILAGVLYLRLVAVDEVCREVEAERDSLRLTMQTMREMSRTHAETVTRIAAFTGKKYKKGGR